MPSFKSYALICITLFVTCSTTQAQQYILQPLDTGVALDSQPYPSWINSRGDITILTTTQTADAPYYSYLLSGGKTRPLDDSNGYYYDINDNGELLGSSLTGPDGLYKKANGTLTYFEYPGSSFTTPYGFNNEGTVVGIPTFMTQQPITPAWVFKDGKFSTFNYPGAKGSAFTTYLTAVNDANVMVGYWIDKTLYSPGQVFPGIGEFIVRNGVTTRFTIDGQGTNDVFVPYQINDSGVIAGTLTIQPLGSGALSYMGYVYKQGKTIKIDYSRTQPRLITQGNVKLILQPNSSTTVNCINNFGEIVGSWSGTYVSADGSVSQSVWKTFVGFPPGFRQP